MCQKIIKFWEFAAKELVKLNGIELESGTNAFFFSSSSVLNGMTVGINGLCIFDKRLVAKHG